MPLTRDQFAENLKRGTKAVRQDIARFCWNQLPSQDRYLVLLNESFDGNPLAPGEQIFADHNTPQTDSRVARTAEEVVERLWREGKIPEWIDITPYEADGDFLYSELRCCGRFTGDELYLYHKKEGYPPFHKFGPILPVGYKDLEQNGKFDLHCYRDKRKPTIEKPNKSLMSLEPEKYLVNAPKRYEFSVGLACALISFATAGLLIWLVYLVAWRNPKVYEVHDLYKATTLAIFLVLFLISLGFSVLAFRLLSSNRNRKWLFSPLLLRLWGAFFAIGGLFMLIVGLTTRDWKVATEALHLIPFSAGMAVAAFLLARKIGQEDNKS